MTNPMIQTDACVERALRKNRIARVRDRSQIPRGLRLPFVDLSQTTRGRVGYADIPEPISLKGFRLPRAGPSCLVQAMVGLKPQRDVRFRTWLVSPWVCAFLDCHQRASPEAARALLDRSLGGAGEPPWGSGEPHCRPAAPTSRVAAVVDQPAAWILLWGSHGQHPPNPVVPRL